MATFVRIVEDGSLTAASGSLNLSLPSVVRLLAHLEKRLGARLLHRTTRRISLTDEGRAFYHRSRQILSEVEEAEACLRQSTAEGTVRITAPVMFGQMHVQPVVHQFVTKFPLVRVELLLADRTVDLLEEGVDLAVRLTHLPDSSQIAFPLGDARLVFCASPRYLARAGAPSHPQDLSRHVCLRYTGFPRMPDWTFDVGGKELKPSVSGPLCCNHIAPLIDACIDGAGIGRFCSYHVAPLVASRRLRVVLDDYAPPPVPVRLVVPTRHLLPARTSLMVDWLREKLPPRIATSRI